MTTLPTTTKQRAGSDLPTVASYSKGSAAPATKAFVKLVPYTPPATASQARQRSTAGPAQESTPAQGSAPTPTEDAALVAARAVIDASVAAALANPGHPPGRGWKIQWALDGRHDVPKIMVVNTAALRDERIARSDENGETAPITYEDGTKLVVGRYEPMLGLDQSMLHWDFTGPPADGVYEMEGTMMCSLEGKLSWTAVRHYSQF